MSAPVVNASSAECITLLQELAAELAAHGWTARVDESRGGPPSLHTRNPEPGAALLAERVYALPRADGTWAYWWPWADPIADTAAEAAAVIVRVLRSAGAP